MASLAEQYADVGAKPLPGDAPDPSWVRDDSPAFAAMNAEIAKLESLSGAQPVDWRALVRTAARVVEAQSKDLLAISYLCRGLYELEGYAGLAAGLRVLRDVVDQHWERAYPPIARAKRRGNEIGWLIDKLTNPVSQTTPTDGDREAVYRVHDLVAELSEKLAERLKDDAPQFRKVRDPVKGYRDTLAARQQAEEEAAKAAAAAEAARAEAARAAAAPAAEPAAEPAVPAPQAEPRPGPVTASPAPVSGPATGEPASEGEVRKAVKETRQAVRRIALFWRSRKLSDPRPYVILRFAAWMDVSGPPKIPLPGPTRNQIGECRRLQEEGDHRALIEYVEDLFSNPDAPPNCHWLDAHRYTAGALAALGADHDRARQGVVQALRYYLGNFPGTLEMRFTTDVDYADPQTRAWIQTEVMTAGAEAPAAAGRAAHGSDLGAAVAEALAKARPLAARGESQAAVAVLQDRLRQARSGRETFSWALEQARFCVELGYSDVAASLLEGLRDRIDYYHLDEWEPELSVETLKLLLQTLPKAGPSDPGRLVELRSRLSRLDAVAALATLAKR